MKNNSKKKELETKENIEGLRIYKSRLDDEYRVNLREELDKYIVYEKGENIKSYCDSIRNDLLSIEEQTRKDFQKINLKDENGNDISYCHCLRINFCGMSASTLLNTHSNPEDLKNLLNKNIADSFKKLISRSNCDKLNENGIYLQIKFLFSYMYSEMPFSLMKAERIRTRVRKKNSNEFVDYDFSDEPGLTEKEFNESKLKRTQDSTLIALQEIIDDDDYNHLKFSLPNEALNTIGIRFTPIPLQFCMLSINRMAYMDSYMYAKQDKRNHLSYLIPLIEINLNKGNNEWYYKNLEYHFDYLWNHDLTFRASDGTGILESKQSLSTIKLPFEIDWEMKKAFTISHLQYHQIDLEEYSDEKMRKWKINIGNRFTKTTKLPFNYKNAVNRPLTIIFTDFENFSEVAANNDANVVADELDHCFNEFEKICLEYEIIKIKTIGDSFMCVAGLSSGQTQTKNAIDAIEAAKKMIDYYVTKRMNDRAANGNIYFKGIRIGINSGTVIVQRKQNELDVFGKEVNIAKRMEQKSIRNRINLYEKTYVLIKDIYTTENNGWYKDSEGKSGEMWLVK